MSVSLGIEPIASPSTAGWDDTIFVQADGVPKEGDGLSVNVNGEEYEVRVRWVFWTMNKEGRLMPTVRVA